MPPCPRATRSTGTAAGLRPYLVGRTVLAATSTRGADVGRLVGSTVTAVDTLGKNVLIRSSSGLTVRTHLRMNGTWHRYRPAEPWRLPASRAALVLEVEGAVAVCFDAPVVEVFETRAQAIHPGLAPLGADLTADQFDAADVVTRLREPGRAGDRHRRGAARPAGHGRGGQRLPERDPVPRARGPVRAGRARSMTGRSSGIVATARRLLLANIGPGSRARRSTTGGAREAAGAPLWVYRRTGRPCRRCGTPIRAASLGRDLPRTVWWCPRCQVRRAVDEA